jgi:hypothetical protein
MYSCLRHFMLASIPKGIPHSPAAAALQQDDSCRTAASVSAADARRFWRIFLRPARKQWCRGRVDDADAFPGSGVNRRPAPQLLVPGPAAGIKRLRADRGCLRLETDWINASDSTRQKSVALCLDVALSRTKSLSVSGGFSRSSSRGPAAGVKRLRADRGCLRLEASMKWIHAQTQHN